MASAPKTTVIIGSQWGDEGKGKVVDVLAKKADIIVRYSGGNNAGHTVVVGKEVYKLHLLPSGIVNKKQCIIGQGVVLDPAFLIMEIERIQSRGITTAGRLWIDPRTHIIMPWHPLLDVAREIRKGKDSIGTTQKGIGPCYEDRYAREGIRFEDLVNPQLLKEKIAILYPQKKELLEKCFGLRKLPSQKSIVDAYTDYGKKLKPCLLDVTAYLYEAIGKGKKIIFEGAQGLLLDCNLGTYPFVTSSHPGVAGIAVGTGVAPSAITHVEPIVKAYTTRVGNGPFPTELALEQADSKETYSLSAFADRKKHKTSASFQGEFLRRQGYEFGTTTGRPRRCGWLDLVLLHTGNMWNGYTGLHITKLDVLGGMPEIKVCVSYTLRGKSITTVPASTQDFLAAKPKYISLPGFPLLTKAEWKKVIVKGKTKGFAALPKEARNYIATIERLTKIPILSVSVGPERDAIIFAKK